MYKKKKNKRQLLITIIVSAILFVFITVSLLVSNNGNDKNNIFKNFSMMIDKIVMYPFTALNHNKDITQSESYTIQKNINSSLEKEIQELKDVLELNKTLTEYDPVNATVLSRNRSYWFNTITIDKGSSSGIEKNMAVITKNGLIGKINKVSKNSSEVKLITSNDVNFKVSISVRNNDNDFYAIMNGYQKKTGLISASGIDKTSPINVGDNVYTSGLGELFPAGIYVGVIDKIEMDKFNLSKIIYIKTNQNFNNIHYVTVLKVKK